MIGDPLPRVPLKHSRRTSASVGSNLGPRLRRPSLPPRGPNDPPDGATDPMRHRVTMSHAEERRALALSTPAGKIAAHPVTGAPVAREGSPASPAPTTAEAREQANAEARKATRQAAARLHRFAARYPARAAALAAKYPKSDLARMLRKP
jgi:hypothetical protein